MPQRSRASRRARFAGLALLAALVIAAVVGNWLLTRPRKTSILTLSATSFAALDGWSVSDPRPAIDAFRRSCGLILAFPKDRQMSGQGYGGNARDWVGVCGAIPRPLDVGSARHWFETKFVPFVISSDTSSMGTFTGYYEPEVHGSRKAHGVYRWPVYGVPDDLIDVNLGVFSLSLKGESIVGRLLRHTLVPYPTRADIDHAGISGAPILFYTDDLPRLFFLQIQGSGRVRFENGMIERVAYAVQNGWPYTPIGRVLVQEGTIPRDHLSMQSILGWMDAHPGAARDLMEKDKSYVFFKEQPLGDPALGSPGAEGVPLTPGASLAVDSHFHPLGAPFYVVAQESNGSGGVVPMRQLLVAQDIGGAIRGAVRGDVFFGYGTRAEDLAGTMKSEGKMFVLLPQALARRTTGEGS